MCQGIQRTKAKVNLYRELKFFSSPFNAYLLDSIQDSYTTKLRATCHEQSKAARRLSKSNHIDGEDNKSRIRSSKSSPQQTTIKPVTAIIEDVYSSSLLLKDKKKEEGRRFKRQNKIKKTRTTVARIIPQQRVPVQGG